MYAIKNKQEEIVAVIQNNIIFSATDQHVLGIIIGDCIYGKSHKMVGKIFNSTFYLLNGQVAGKVEVSQAFKVKVIRKEHMVDAWSILGGVKEHTSQWITEKKTWSTKEIQEHLL